MWDVDQMYEEDRKRYIEAMRDPESAVAQKAERESMAQRKSSRRSVKQQAADIMRDHNDRKSQEDQS